MKNINVAIGTEEDFFARGRVVAAAADLGEAIKPSHSITFENPEELLNFMTPKRLLLLKALREQASSITNLAERVHRDRSAVSKDLVLLQKAGVVNVETKLSPGHGTIKMVHAVAQKIDLHVAI